MARKVVNKPSTSESHNDSTSARDERIFIESMTRLIAGDLTALELLDLNRDANVGDQKLVRTLRKGKNQFPIN